MASPSPFPGIAGTNSGSGTFNQYNGPYVPPPADDGKALDKAASKLHKCVAVAAIHNSADQGADAPRCDPQTREAVQLDIHSRLSHPGEQGGHIWLTGPAGTGKTAIVGSVCDKLAKEGRLAATFYFSSHKNSRNRKSKKDFVTTLAHQFRGHQDLNEHISTSMLSAIRRQPEILDMVLARQAGALILQPFRDAKTLDPSTFTSPFILAVDGIDECEEDHYKDRNQSRQKDQLEVLRVLLALAKDPSFPCRIIIASRPETWIRDFFEGKAAGHFKEMFLGKDYNADTDIQLYFKSHFSRISLKYGYTASEWPKKEDLGKLVENASGHFIYAATVIRFVDSDWPLPKDQLKLVLQVKSPVAGSNPLATLDELYTTIIKKSSPCPDITIIWLQGIRIVKWIMRDRMDTLTLNPGFIHLFFESTESQAVTVLALPSLIGSGYNFYHKSFVDYLKDTARSGIAFPGVDDFAIKQWLAERISKVLECDGPRVQLPPEKEDMFRQAIVVIWFELMATPGLTPISQDVLAKSSPEIWCSQASLSTLSTSSHKHFMKHVYVLVHIKCHFYTHCGAGCRQWRKAIMGHPEYRQWLTEEWNSSTRLLDKLCIKRVHPPPI